MTMAKTGILMLALAVVFFTACKKEEAPPVDLGYGYYPTKVGSWVEYQVDSLWRDDRFNILDSVSYRLRQLIESEYVDLEGRSAWRMHRMVQDTAGNWSVRDVWSTTVNGIAAELTEENERRQKLTFPVRIGRTWDINVYNTVPELAVAYAEVDVPWAVNGLSFDSTLIVRQTVPANFVARRDLEERYAKHVGMVRKSQVETTTQFVNVPGQPPQLRLVGTWWTMEAVDHGSN